jgi:hypothetical protein
MSTHKSRPAALTGIAFLVLVVVVFIVSGEPPDPAKDSPIKIADWYADHSDQVKVSAFVGVVAIALLLFYGAYLRAELTAAGAERSILPRVAFAGLILFATGLAIDVTLSLALADYSDDMSPAATQAVAAIYTDDFVPFAAGVTVFLLATGLSIVRHGGLPKWLGWVAIVFGVVGFTPAGFVSFIVTGLFIGGTSILLAVRAGQPDEAAEPPAQMPPPVPAEPAAA